MPIPTIDLKDFGLKSLQSIPIDDCQCNDWNFNSMPEEKFNALKANILSFGFRAPITVIENPDAAKKGQKPYIIVDGEHRWKATKDAGFKEILAVIAPYDLKEAQLNSVAANMITGDPIAIKMAEVLASMKEKYTEDEIAQFTGLAKEEQKQYLDLLEPPPIDDDLKLGDPEELPVELTLHLVPEGFENFNEGMEAAIERYKQTGKDVVYQVGDQVHAFEGAFKDAQEIGDTKNRAIALELLAAVFARVAKEHSDLVDEVALELNEKRAPKRPAPKEASESTDS